MRRTWRMLMLNYKRLNLKSKNYLWISISPYMSGYSYLWKKLNPYLSIETNHLAKL